MAVLDRAHWPAIPDLHAAFVERTLETLPRDPQIVAIALGGSFVTGRLDDQSDLDFVIAVEPDAWPAILDDRARLAGELGELLACFTGEHVGEPRLLVCLYGPPLLHVDFKFLSLEDAGVRVEDPAILWERDGRLSAVFAGSEARFPGPDPQWIEDRFWIWVHYTAGKVERGELFEAVEGLGFMRLLVLGPLALERAGVEQPQGVRRIEQAAPEFAARLEACVTRPRVLPCLDALDTVIDLYEELRRDAGHEPAEMGAAEREMRRYVGEVRERLG